MSRLINRHYISYIYNVSAINTLHGPQMCKGEREREREREEENENTRTQEYPAHIRVCVRAHAYHDTMR